MASMHVDYAHYSSGEDYTFSVLYQENKNESVVQIQDTYGYTSDRCQDNLWNCQDPIISKSY